MTPFLFGCCFLLLKYPDIYILSKICDGVVYFAHVDPTRWSGGDLSGLRAFFDRTPECVAAVLAYSGKEAVELSNRLFAIPLGHLLA